jgi:hypothetical protein
MNFGSFVFPFTKACGPLLSLCRCSASAVAAPEMMLSSLLQRLNPGRDEGSDWPS